MQHDDWCEDNTRKMDRAHYLNLAQFNQLLPVLHRHWDCGLELELGKLSRIRLWTHGHQTLAYASINPRWIRKEKKKQTQTQQDCK